MQKSKKRFLKTKLWTKKKKQTNSFPINEIQYIIGIEHETASNIHMASNIATRRQLKQSIFLTLKCLNHWLQKAPYHMLQPRDWHQATSVLTGKEIKNILTGKKNEGKEIQIKDSILAEIYITYLTINLILQLHRGTCLAEWPAYLGQRIRV